MFGFQDNFYLPESEGDLPPELAARIGEPVVVSVPDIDNPDPVRAHFEDGYVATVPAADVQHVPPAPKYPHCATCTCIPETQSAA